MGVKQISLDNNLYTIADRYLREQIARKFDSSNNYNIRDFCIYNNQLYQCIEDCSGDWDSSCWEIKKITDLGKEKNVIYYIDNSENWNVIDSIINKTITEIDSDGIYIRPFTFLRCYSLQSVEFPECTIINSQVFAGCSSLQSISFPVCTTIGSYAFNRCVSLQSASFPECIIINNWAFHNCTSLQSVEFPKCTIINDYVFYNCTSLQSINFSKCTTINDGAFYNCTSLQSINFSKCTIVSSQAFYNCTSLQSVSFPECITIGINVFGECTSLQSASFPKCTIISDYAFYNCTSLQSINFSQCITIGSNAFRQCSSLQSFYLLASTVCTLNHRNAFYNTPIQQSSHIGTFGSIYVPASLVDSYKAATNWTNYADRIIAFTG